MRKVCMNLHGLYRDHCHEPPNGDRDLQNQRNENPPVNNS